MPKKGKKKEKTAGAAKAEGDQQEEIKDVGFIFSDNYRTALNMSLNMDGSRSSLCCATHPCLIWSSPTLWRPCAQVRGSEMLSAKLLSSTEGNFFDKNKVLVELIRSKSSTKSLPRKTLTPPLRIRAPPRVNPQVGTLSHRLQPLQR